MGAEGIVAGRYRLEEPIGRGGMGSVWRATDTELRRTVALKRGMDVRREARVLAGLHHPNVIAVFDAVEENGDRWLVMEYLPARSLAAILASEGPLTPQDAARVGAQIADALVALHERGMVHRDITPGNVLVTSDLTAKLTDFGIAVWGDVTQSGDATAGGTPGYIADEVIQGYAATPASDMFSLGATLAAAVEGHAASDGVDGGPLAPVLSALRDPDPLRRPTATRAGELLLDVAAGTRGRPRQRALRWATPWNAALMVVVVAWWLLDPSSTTSIRPPAAVTTAASVPAILGNPATADPCALTDANALSRFGNVELATDYGGFNRCDVLVHLSQDHEDYVDVRLELDVGSPGTPRNAPAAPISIQRLPEQDGECQRLLLLPGQYQVSIDAHEHSNKVVDLCGMADALTSSALVQLDRANPIPRRIPPLPAASLASKDACGLLDTKVVSSVLGPGAIQREPGFAHWECYWTNAGRTSVRVVFDRNGPLTPGEDGSLVELSGRDAFVQPGGDSDTSCLVSVVYRSYTDPDGQPTVDLVDVVVDGPQAPDLLCTPARTLAGTAARRLLR